MSTSEAPAAGSDTDPGDGREHRSIGRAATTITLWNLVSRLTGFVRVLATASVLGIAVLGDTYQRTNQVSNVLFELLAGGMLFSVLVPSFVEDLRVGARRRAVDLAGALATRGLAAMGVLVVIGMLLARPISDLLTANADASTRDAQAELGAVLLLFVLPQLLFYVVGAVANGLLQADHRFAATSAAPALSNIAVIITMIVFATIHDPARGLDLTRGEQVVLGGGTLLGTILMTALPLAALHRAGLGLRPRWRVDHDGLGDLVRRGLWGAGHVGLNQVLVMSTVVLAGSVPGGVIAYQTAFSFFLLPHALLAHPIFTALYPRLARDGAALQQDRFAADLGRGLRAILVLLLPASAVMGVAAAPALSVVGFGQLDSSGTRMVAMALASYLVGLAGYSTFFLLTRASYALGDARLPTLVNVVLTGATIIAMATVAAVTDGTTTLVGFGLVTAITVSSGSIALFLLVERRLDRRVRAAGTTVRSTVAAAVGAGAGAAVANAIGWGDVGSALLATSLGGAVTAAVSIGLLRMWREPGLASGIDRVGRLVTRFAGRQTP